MSAYGLARNWWLILLRGLFAVLFVLAAFFGTYLTLVALVLLFGAYALADGILGVIAGLRGCLLKRELPHIRRSKSLPTTKCGDKRPFKKQPLTRHTGSRPWWLLLIEGLIGIVAGVLTFLSPGLTALALLYLIAAWAIITGMVEIVSAIRLRAEIENEGLLALSGVLSVMLGVVLVIWPGASALGLVWLIGAYALVSSLLQIGLGFRLWNLQKKWLSLRALRPVRVGVNSSM